MLEHDFKATNAPDRTNHVIYEATVLYRTAVPSCVHYYS